MTVNLPEPLAQRVQDMPEWRMGAHRITVILTDGRTFSPVDVAWAKEIVRVQGVEDIPFTAEDIAEVFDASGA